MKEFFTLLVLGSAISFNAAEVLIKSVEDYYWRDYHDAVPSDAIPGGHNQYGATAYIGQMSVVSDNKKMQLIPAIVTNGEKTVIAPHARTTIKSQDDSNVKILCTQYPANYFWHNDSDPIEPGCRYVVVGQERMIPLYVGRSTYKNLTLFGLVYSDYHSGNKVYIPYEGEQVKLDVDTTLMYCY